jgi:SAM-dependent methyltransferase
MKKNEYSVMNEIENYHWWFIGKGILINNICKSLFHSLSKDRRMLDLGCGTGAILNILKEFGHSYGIEISHEAVKYLKNKNIKDIIVSDANKPIPCKENKFSLITCLDVLEHVDNDIRLINEMLRVCEQDGYMVITVPAFNILWSYHDEALYHKRRYSKKQLIEMLDKSNCRIIKATYYNFSFFLPVLIFRKLRGIFADKKKEIHSDCYVSVPPTVNKLFSILLCMEIWCLRFFNFPFGVSFLLILQKTGK